MGIFEYGKGEEGKCQKDAFLCFLSCSEGFLLKIYINGIC